MNLIEEFTHRRDTLSELADAPWILVFDIDSTLMDTSFRNRAILEAAIPVFPSLDLPAEEIGNMARSWNIIEPIRARSILSEADLGLLESFWRERFFTDEWLRWDQPYSGAAEFLWELKGQGFDLVYLTGRHRNGMERGTRESFECHGFPTEETFLFKLRFEDSDADFKRTACAHIEHLGTVVGSMDNEPANVNLMVRNFPRALNVWMQTIVSPRAENLLPGIPSFGPDIFLER